MDSLGWRLTSTSMRAYHSIVWRHPMEATARSKSGGQIAPARYEPLDMSASAEPRLRSNQRLT
jgi:hypothetical protein